jgi:peptidoglycan hydrolase-like protein with peptidoglycan-binding domain
MKKILIAGVIALAAVVTVSTVNAAFDNNLSVGSTGADVSALQTVLMGKGFDIPSIKSGAAMPGYFGQQTKTAVMAYQASVNVPTTGFVGPLTRAALNSAGGTTGTVGGTTGTITVPFPCPAGYNPPAPWVCPTTGGTTGTGVTADGTDGSLSVTTSSFVSTGASVKKGETKNVVAVKLQATAGPVKVTRVDAHFSVRPWLFFSTVTLKDSAGNVLATKPLSSIADVTEISIGSDYLVRFEGLNFVVTPGTNPDLVVGVSVLSSTDKIATGGTSVTANITSNSIRTINGLGFTDSVGGVALASPLTTSGAGASTFTLTSTGSVADISTRISPNAPATQATEPISATVATNGVELGVFSLKSANSASIVNNLKFQVNINSAASKTAYFSNVRLMVGSQSYGALTFDTAGLATFTNLNFALPLDQWTDVKLVADMIATTTDVIASSTLLGAWVDATDSTYTAATVGGLAMSGAAASNQVSVNTLLTVSSVSLGLSATPAIVVQEIKGLLNSSQTTAANVAYTFTLTNNSSNSLYVSSNVATLINATTTSPAANASSTISTIEPVAAVAGDASGYYILPSSGGSRTFTVSGIIQKSSGGLRSERLSITSIQYGNTTAGTGSNITSGLEKLTVAITI